MNQQNKYSCIIIDDEPIAIKVIKEHLEKTDHLQCAGSFTKALLAIELLNREAIDLIFLDINMPGISGIEFLKSLPNPPKVIFTTAYRNFAVDAFELDAIDYLVKPISFERFLKSANKFLSAVMTIDSNNTQNKTVKEFIILKSDKKNYKMQFKDILYIESLDNYIKVHTSNNSIICYESLSNLMQELSIDFVRIHRSYIVNIKKVDVFTTAYLQIEGTKLTVGRNYREKVSGIMNN